jgi:sulfate permease, SulP family
MSLPGAMAYGVLVFGVLGPDGASRGLVAGLVALALCNLVTAPLAGCKVMACSPHSLSALMLAAAVVQLADGAGDQPGLPIDMVFQVVFVAIFLAGFIQLAVGALRLGDLAKFVPYPVTCGLLTGTGLVILRSQLGPLLGVPRGGNLLTEFHWGNLAVGCVTCGVAFFAPRATKKYPAPVLALLMGTATYYLLEYLDLEDHLGPTIGAIPAGLPRPDALLGMLGMLGDGGLLERAAVVIPLAFGLSIVASLGTLISCIAGDALSGERSNTSRELVSQGLGNLACGAFGGLAGAGSPSRTVANYNYGGRGRLSRVVAGVLALLTLVVAGPAVALLPRVVLAGLLVVLAIGLVDLWIVRTAWGLIRRTEADAPVALTNVAIAVLVTALMLTIGVLEAVAAGLLLAQVYFVVRMGKQIVRRTYNGAEVHSNVQRCAVEYGLLQKTGQRIVVVELEGSLFFGTADRVATEVELISSGETFAVILDLRRTNELDLTGAKILGRCVKECQKRGAWLLLSYSPRSAVAQHLRIHGVLETVGESRCFGGVNDALAWAEDRLLDQLLEADRYSTERALGSVDALSQLEPGDLEWLKSSLVRREFAADELIFSQGAPGDRVLFITAGRVRITADLTGERHDTNLATLCPGTLLGELAVVDGRPRSATAAADGQVVCFELEEQRLQELIQERPLVGSKIMAGICREIATRLRIANRALN